MTAAVSVVATDEQDAHAVDVDRYRDLAHRSLLASGVGGEAELNLLFVDESTMAALNGHHMGEVGSTDVLAFPIDQAGVDGPGPQLLGDVVVCPAVAARYADDHGRLADDEIALLVIHGVLHVLGMDHAHPDDAAAMQARERELLAAWWRPGLDAH